VTFKFRQEELMQDIRSIYITKWRDVRDYFKAFASCSFQSYLSERRKNPKNPYSDTKLTHIDDEMPLVYAALTGEERQWIADLKVSLDNDGGLINTKMGIITCGKTFISHRNIFELMGEVDFMWICYDEMMDASSETMITCGKHYMNEVVNSPVLKQCVTFLDEYLLPWFFSVFHYNCKPNQERFIHSYKLNRGLQSMKKNW
jgi:hypothetical protein